MTRMRRRKRKRKRRRINKTKLNLIESLRRDKKITNYNDHVKIFTGDTAITTKQAFFLSLSLSLSLSLFSTITLNIFLKYIETFMNISETKKKRAFEILKNIYIL